MAVLLLDAYVIYMTFMMIYNMMRDDALHRYNGYIATTKKFMGGIEASAAGLNGGGTAIFCVYSVYTEGEAAFELPV